MNKVVAGSVLGVGGAGTGITVAYSAGAFGRNGVDAEAQPPQVAASTQQIEERSSSETARPSFSAENTQNDYDKWQVLSDFGNFREQDAPDCIRKVFSGVETLNGVTGYTESVSSDTDKNVNFSFSKDKNSDGCLVVTWHRKEATEAEKVNKYTGDFTLLWSFAQENTGFIVYANVDFSTHGNTKAVTKGLIYALSKESGNQKPWKIDSQYEVSGQEIDNNGDKLPKPGNVLKELEDKDFWGLEGTNKNKEDLVKENDLGNNPNNKSGGSYWKWVGSKDENKQVTDFSSNLNTWWAALFKDSKNDIPKSVENISGNWEKILIVNDRSQLAK